jgi:site-specific recombinase XerD
VDQDRQAEGFPSARPEGVTFGCADNNAELVREYLGWLRFQRRKASTIYYYAQVLGSFVVWVGHTPLEAVRPAVMEAWLARPRTRRGKGAEGAPATVAREISMLRGLYGYLHARERIRRNPTILLARPRLQQRQPQTVPDDIWRSMWTLPLPDDARVVLGLGYYLGLRRAEITSLRVDQVLISARRLVAFVRKGGGEDSLDYGTVLDIYAELLPHLIPGGPETFLRPFHSLVEARRGRRLLLDWGETIPERTLATRVHARPAGHIDPQAFNKRLRGWLRRVGMPGAFTPHDLRRSAATNLIRAGLSEFHVAEVLGHASLQTTKAYVRAGRNELQEWLDGQRALRNVRPFAAGEFSRFA